MPRRLVIPAFVCIAFLGLGAGGTAADVKEPLRGVRVESPARFVPTKVPVRLTISQRAVRLARKQLGTPYVYGGASPSGFDCSGLVMWVYGRLGLSLPHNAAALFGIGRPVPRSAIRPGDLLFFSGLGHVGMYVGHGRMIHAPQSGRSVEIQALSARHGSYVGARRVAA